MKPFDCNIDNKLLYLLRAGGVEPDDAAIFFGSQIIAMQNCEPNYTSKQNNSKVKLEFKGSFWVMRGFYPNLPVMFKIIMVDTTSNNTSFYAKVELITPKIQRGHLYKTRFDNSMFHKLSDDKANQILVSDTAEPIIKLTQRHPKCMSPKGCPIFNIKAKV